ncbi:class D sortase [Bacillus horti]|uniref:Sortase A n=1 Tax=Caldalkalibacillus horti TaxID=77523 RepID=A0ABT9W425_9BACI|nr:class D sortase [Bacillus horti]MDQ0167993.1 sortase A [Bacillus horti]
MQANKLIFKLMFVVFCLSFILLGFAGWSIYMEQKFMDDALREWEAMFQEADMSQIEDDLTLTQLVALEDTQKENSYKTAKEGDVIGKLSLPSVDIEVPIIMGTGDQELAMGVGHYIGSAFPGEQNQTVLSGHRQTVFRQLEKVQLGAEAIAETLDGRFTYEIVDMFVVDKEDRGVIVPQDKAILTLVTCYPFNFVGAAPKRYIIQAELVEEHYSARR